jgi:copper chaperone CopZ
MTCDHCRGRVEGALRDVAGVYGAYVDVDDGSAEVDFDGERATADALVAAVKSAGYDASVAA